MQNNGKPLITIVIPVKNEARSIQDLINTVDENLPRLTHEIIVVDDGSSDNTRQIAESILPAGQVISHARNLGKGAAMKTGAKHAKSDIIVFIDGDGAHSPGDIPALVSPILEKKATLVNGSRTLPGASVSNSKLKRRLSNGVASIVITIIISFFLPAVTLARVPFKFRKITDCTSGFRAITYQAWRKLNLTSEGFQIETEIIYEAARNNFVIAEVPIDCNWNPNFSRLSIVRDGFTTSRLLLKKLAGDFGGRQNHRAGNSR